MVSLEGYYNMFISIRCLHKVKEVTADKNKATSSATMSRTFNKHLPEFLQTYHR